MITKKTKKKKSNTWLHLMLLRGFPTANILEKKGGGSEMG